MPRLSRFLLAGAALILTLGATMHALAFPRTATAVAASNLQPFFGSSLKLLWLGDSATMFGLAAILGLLAVRPSSASRAVVVLLSLIPAATAVLLYTFLGTFFAGHLLLAAAAATFVAGVTL